MSRTKPISDSLKESSQTEIPGWAYLYVGGALRCGIKAPEIEERLVAKGLSRSMAQKAVNESFEARFRAANLQRQRAVRRKWTNRIAAVLVALVQIVTGYWFLEPYVAARYSVNVIFCVACIWFAKPFGEYVDYLSIHRKTGGLFVSIAAWFYLILATIGIFLWLYDR